MSEVRPRWHGTPEGGEVDLTPAFVVGGKSTVALLPADERPNRRRGITPLLRLTWEEWKSIGRQMSWTREGGLR